MGKEALSLLMNIIEIKERKNNNELQETIVLKPLMLYRESSSGKKEYLTEGKILTKVG
jgi:hypothetical protein